MAGITTRDCKSVVSNRYELVLLAADLARELSEPSLPDRTREAKTMTALRHIAERAANPEVLRINAWRRRRDIPLLGESNDNGAPVDPASAEPQAA
jgi:DNA-directed RNA polymerase omega subunit